MTLSLAAVIAVYVIVEVWTVRWLVKLDRRSKSASPADMTQAHRWLLAIKSELREWVNLVDAVAQGYDTGRLHDEVENVHDISEGLAHMKELRKVVVTEVVKRKLGG